MSLGFKQNNPVNLKKGTSWDGVVASDNDFAAFSTMPFGIRAAIVNLYVHVLRGHNTYSSYISEFAPPSDNDTAAYLKHIEDAGFVLSNPISFDRDDLELLLRAQMEQEIGPDDKQITQDQIDEGINFFKSSHSGVILDKIAPLAVKAGKYYLPILIGAIFLLLFFIRSIFKTKKHGSN